MVARVLFGGLNIGTSLPVAETVSCTSLVNFIQLSLFSQKIQKTRLKLLRFPKSFYFSLFRLEGLFVQGNEFVERKLYGVDNDFGYFFNLHLDLENKFALGLIDNY